jgi:prolyl-tRNA synthetase
MIEELEIALIDFVDGKGTGVPSFEVCSTLLQTDMIKDIVKKASNKDIKKIAIQPFDESLISVNNPPFTSQNTRFMECMLNGKSITVAFDRN